MTSLLSVTTMLHPPYWIRATLIFLAAYNGAECHGESPYDETKMLWETFQSQTPDTILEGIFEPFVHHPNMGHIVSPLSRRLVNYVQTGVLEINDVVNRLPSFKKMTKFDLMIATLLAIADGISVESPIKINREIVTRKLIVIKHTHDEQSNVLLFECRGKGSWNIKECLSSLPPVRPGCRLIGEEVVRFNGFGSGCIEGLVGVLWCPFPIPVQLVSRASSLGCRKVPRIKTWCPPRLGGAVLNLPKGITDMFPIKKQVKASYEKASRPILNLPNISPSRFFFGNTEPRASLPGKESRNFVENPQPQALLQDEEPQEFLQGSLFPKSSAKYSVSILSPNPLKCIKGLPVGSLWCPERRSEFSVQSLASFGCLETVHATMGYLFCPPKPGGFMLIPKVLTPSSPPQGLLPKPASQELEPNSLISEAPVEDINLSEGQVEDINFSDGPIEDMRISVLTVPWKCVKSPPTESVWCPKRHASSSIPIPPRFGCVHAVSSVIGGSFCPPRPGGVILVPKQLYQSQPLAQQPAPEHIPQKPLQEAENIELPIHPVPWRCVRRPPFGSVWCPKRPAFPIKPIPPRFGCVCALTSPIDGSFCPPRPGGFVLEPKRLNSMPLPSPKPLPKPSPQSLLPETLIPSKPPKSFVTHINPAPLKCVKNPPLGSVWYTESLPFMLTTPRSGYIPSLPSPIDSSFRPPRPGGFVLGPKQLRLKPIPLPESLPEPTHWELLPEGLDPREPAKGIVIPVLPVPWKCVKNPPPGSVWCPKRHGFSSTLITTRPGCVYALHFTVDGLFCPPRPGGFILAPKQPTASLRPSPEPTPKKPFLETLVPEKPCKSTVKPAHPVLRRCVKNPPIGAVWCPQKHTSPLMPKPPEFGCAFALPSPIDGSFCPPKPRGFIFVPNNSFSPQILTQPEPHVPLPRNPSDYAVLAIRPDSLKCWMKLPALSLCCSQRPTKSHVPSHPSFGCTYALPSQTDGSFCPPKPGGFILIPKDQHISYINSPCPETSNEQEPKELPSGTPISGSPTERVVIPIQPLLQKCIHNPPPGSVWCPQRNNLSSVPIPPRFGCVFALHSPIDGSFCPPRPEGFMLDPKQLRSTPIPTTESLPEPSNDELPSKTLVPESSTESIVISTSQIPKKCIKNPPPESVWCPQRHNLSFIPIPPGLGCVYVLPSPIDGSFCPPRPEGFILVPKQLGSTPIPPTEPLPEPSNDELLSETLVPESSTEKFVTTTPPVSRQCFSNPATGSVWCPQPHNLSSIPIPPELGCVYALPSPIDGSFCPPSPEGFILDPKQFGSTPIPPTEALPEPSNDELLSETLVPESSTERCVTTTPPVSRQCISNPAPGSVWCPQPHNLSSIPIPPELECVYALPSPIDSSFCPPRPGGFILDPKQPDSTRIPPTESLPEPSHEEPLSDTSVPVTSTESVVTIDPPVPRQCINNPPSGSVWCPQKHNLSSIPIPPRFGCVYALPSPVDSSFCPPKLGGFILDPKQLDSTPIPPTESLQDPSNDEILSETSVSESPTEGVVTLTPQVPRKCFSNPPPESVWCPQRHNLSFVPVPPGFGCVYALPSKIDGSFCPPGPGGYILLPKQLGSTPILPPEFLPEPSHEEILSEILVPTQMLSPESLLEPSNDDIILGTSVPDSSTEKVVISTSLVPKKCIKNPPPESVWCPQRHNLSSIPIPPVLGCVYALPSPIDGSFCPPSPEGFILDPKQLGSTPIPPTESLPEPSNDELPSESVVPESSTEKFVTTTPPVSRQCFSNPAPGSVWCPQPHNLSSIPTPPELGCVYALPSPIDGSFCPPSPEGFILDPKQLGSTPIPPTESLLEPSNDELLSETLVPESSTEKFVTTTPPVSRQCISNPAPGSVWCPQPHNLSSIPIPPELGCVYALPSPIDGSFCPPSPEGFILDPKQLGSTPIPPSESLPEPSNDELLSETLVPESSTEKFVTTTPPVSRQCISNPAPGKVWCPQPHNLSSIPIPPELGCVYAMPSPIDGSFCPPSPEGFILDPKQLGSTPMPPTEPLPEPSNDEILSETLVPESSTEKFVTTVPPVSRQCFISPAPGSVWCPQPHNLSSIPIPPELGCVYALPSPIDGSFCPPSPEGFILDPKQLGSTPIPPTESLLEPSNDELLSETLVPESSTEKFVTTTPPVSRQCISNPAPGGVWCPQSHNLSSIPIPPELGCVYALPSPIDGSFCPPSPEGFILDPKQLGSTPILPTESLPEPSNDELLSETLVPESSTEKFVTTTPPVSRQCFSNPAPGSVWCPQPHNLSSIPIPPELECVYALPSPIDGSFCPPSPEGFILDPKQLGSTPIPPTGSLAEPSNDELLSETLVPESSTEKFVTTTQPVSRQCISNPAPGSVWCPQPHNLSSIPIPPEFGCVYALPSPIDGSFCPPSREGFILDPKQLGSMPIPPTKSLPEPSNDELHSGTLVPESSTEKFVTTTQPVSRQCISNPAPGSVWCPQPHNLSSIPIPPEFGCVYALPSPIDGSFCPPSREGFILDPKQLGSMPIPPTKSLPEPGNDELHSGTLVPESSTEKFVTTTPPVSRQCISNPAAGSVWCPQPHNLSSIPIPPEFGCVYALPSPIDSFFCPPRPGGFILNSTQLDSTPIPPRESLQDPSIDEIRSETSVPESSTEGIVTPTPQVPRKCFSNPPPESVWCPQRHNLSSIPIPPELGCVYALPSPIDGSFCPPSPEGFILVPSQQGSTMILPPESLAEPNSDELLSEMSLSKSSTERILIPTPPVPRKCFSNLPPGSVWCPQPHNLPSTPIPPRFGCVDALNPTIDGYFCPPRPGGYILVPKRPGSTRLLPNKALPEPCDEKFRPKTPSRGLTLLNLQTEGSYSDSKITCKEKDVLIKLLLQKLAVETTKDVYLSRTVTEMKRSILKNFLRRLLSLVEPKQPLELPVYNILRKLLLRETTITALMHANIPNDLADVQYFNLVLRLLSNNIGDVRAQDVIQFYLSRFSFDFLHLLSVVPAPSDQQETFFYHVLQQFFNGPEINKIFTGIDFGRFADLQQILKYVLAHLVDMEGNFEANVAEAIRFYHQKIYGAQTYDGEILTKSSSKVKRYDVGDESYSASNNTIEFLIRVLPRPSNNIEDNTSYNLLLEALRGQQFQKLLLSPEFESLQEPQMKLLHLLLSLAAQENDTPFSSAVNHYIKLMVQQLYGVDFDSLFKLLPEEAPHYQALLEYFYSTGLIGILEATKNTTTNFTEPKELLVFLLETISSTTTSEEIKRGVDYYLYKHFRSSFYATMQKISELLPTPKTDEEKQHHQTLKRFLLGPESYTPLKDIDLTLFGPDKFLLEMILKKLSENDLDPTVVEACKFYLDYVEKLASIDLVAKKEIKGRFKLTEIFTDTLDLQRLSSDQKAAFKRFFKFISEIEPESISRVSSWDQATTRGQFMKLLFKYFLTEADVPEEIKGSIAVLDPLVQMTGKGALPP